MFLRYLFYGLLIYMAYRFIVGFLIPVFRTTRQVKRQFRDMQEKMQEHYSGNIHENQSSSFNNSPQTERPAPKKSAKDDYIDFEEIKEK